MSRILADREIKKLFTDVIRGGDTHCVNPNGVELRLGNRIRYMSTGEEFDIPAGHFVKVGPGESVIIVSLEHIDFSAAAVAKHFPGCALMALITPTTTMMREGITQAATKVDAGFVGQLNWGLRNSSYKDLILEAGERIFKLTLMLLENDEVPEAEYGRTTDHKYQNTSGILLSARRIPADIPKLKIVCSSVEKLDPKKQLREAGYPFSHIGTELIQLHGQFEMVSKDVLLLKDDIAKRTGELATKLDTETKSVLDKIEATKEHAEHLFSKKFTIAVGAILGGITIIAGGVPVVQKYWGTPMVLCVALAATGVIAVITWALARKTK
jgi:deoxycytidine triphosphate deaminase